DSYTARGVVPAGTANACKPGAIVQPRASMRANSGAYTVWRREIVGSCSLRRRSTVSRQLFQPVGNGENVFVSVASIARKIFFIVQSLVHAASGEQREHLLPIRPQLRFIVLALLVAREDLAEQILPRKQRIRQVEQIRVAEQRAQYVDVFA